MGSENTTTAMGSENATTAMGSENATTVASHNLRAHDVAELLLSVTSDLLGLNSWPDQSCILELGVNSFDVVRLANQFEFELRQKTGSIPELPQLVDQLLARSLCEVTSYVLSQMSNCPGSACDTNGEHISEEDATTLEWEARKRLRKELQDQVAPPAKMFHACSPGSTDKVLHWLACRRGQHIEDGR